MKNSLRPLAIGFVLSSTHSALAALSATGDIAFISYAPQEENFAFVALSNIAAGQAIFFDDEEWTGSSFDNPTAEGNVRWTNSSGAAIQAGTVITIIDAGNDEGRVANIGTIKETNSGFNLAPIDGLFAYLGADRDPSTFLAGIGDADSASGLTSLTGTGLALGLSALDTNGAEAIEYTGPRSGLGDLSNYLVAINDIANWSVAPQIITGTFNTSSFGAIPEPSAFALLGIACLAYCSRRSR